jgi:hypothetical protein
MNKLFLLSMIFFISLRSASAITYIVSPDGSDSNPGTAERPFKSIQKAADKTEPGDTVLVKTGTYTQYLHSGTTINIHNSGELDAYIVFKAYPGNTPKIISPTWNAFDLRGGVAYIELNGFEIEGVPDAMSDSSGNGIFCSEKAHHIRILNNVVYNVPGGGIGSSGCDYIHIEGNIVHHTSFYSGYQNSGISLYQNYNFDDAPGYHNIIRNNFSFSNENIRLPLWGGNVVTDGNGIIIDDFRNVQGDGAHVPYTGSTLIENNVVFDNGGRGVHCYLSDHVVAVNNTLYKNSRSSDISDGELTAGQSGDIIFMNNIVYAADIGTRGNKTWDATNITFDYNLYFNTKTLSVKGEHDIRDLDPLYIKASTDADSADFRLQEGSPAIDAGSSEYAPSTDITGGPRVIGAGIDLGAYESPYETTIDHPWETPASHLLPANYPNPFNASTTITFSLPMTDFVELIVFDARGQLIRTLAKKLMGAGTQSIVWDGKSEAGTEVSSGLYFIHLNTASGYRLAHKITLLK